MPMQPRVHFEVSPLAGKAYPLELDAFPVAIGRSPRCEVTLDDPKASRRHAAIEWDDDGALFRDLGSANGTALDGRRQKAGRLLAGSELRVGSTVLRLVEISGLSDTAVADDPVEEERDASADEPDDSEFAGDSESAASDSDDARPGAGAAEGDGNDLIDLEAEAAREEAENLAAERIRRRRLVGIVGPLVTIVIVGGLCAGIAYWYVNREPEPAPPMSPELTAALRDRSIIEARIAAADRITSELIGAVRTLQRRHLYTELPRDEQSFEDLITTLQLQHDTEIRNRSEALSRLRAKLMEERRYGEALDVVRAESDAIAADSGAATLWAAGFLETTEAAIGRHWRDAGIEIAELESTGEFDAALDAWDGAILTFAGTRYAKEAASERRAFVERREAAKRERARQLAEERKRRRLERIASRRREAPEVVEEPKTLAGQLCVLLVPRIRGGCFDEATFAFPEFEGRVLAVRGPNMVIRVGDGDRNVRVDKIPPATLVALANECLAGEDLLLAAEIGYRADLTKEADALTRDYLRSTGAPRGVSDVLVGELLAEVRGLGRVPEGGFKYSTRYGWEDLRQIAQREALARSKKLVHKLGTARSDEKLRQYFEPLHALLAGKALTRQTRATIRQQAAAELAEVHAKTVVAIMKRIQRTGYARLRKARAELEKRRAAALAVIYDPKIYLPENHPDWRKGDVVNGQKQVDDLVAEVRELWDNAGSYLVQLDPKTIAQTKMLRTIEDELFRELRHEFQRDADSTLEDLHNNLDRRVDLRSFVRDRKDADQNHYNRAVEKYNAELTDERVSESDKAHVVVVNDYREMMGRRRLFIDARLCRATRKHSEECNKAGRIWHNGPDGTPQTRARAEGYTGGVGENVAIGYANPKDIWVRGWYRASDHHRNGLGARWTCVGYGYVGRVGTQNFGSIGAPFQTGR